MENLNQSFLTFRDIARVIPVSEKTLRNKSSRGELPFSTLLLMGKRVVRAEIFGAYLNSLDAPTTRSVAPISPPPKKRGRPTKAEQLARDAAKAKEVSHG